MKDILLLCLLLSTLPCLSQQSGNWPAPANNGSSGGSLGNPKDRSGYIKKLEDDLSKSTTKLEETESTLRIEKEKAHREGIISTDQIVNLEKDKEYYKGECSRLTAAVIEASKKNFTLEEKNLILKDSLKLQTDTAVYYKGEAKRYKKWLSDFADTKKKLIFIDVTKPYSNVFELCCFSPSKNDIPKMTLEQDEYLQRLINIIKNNHLKVTIIGYANFENMTKRGGERLAYDRAAKFRGFIIDKYGLTEEYIWGLEGSIKKCSSCNSVMMSLDNQ